MRPDNGFDLGGELTTRISGTSLTARQKYMRGSSSPDPEKHFNRRFRQEFLSDLAGRRFAPLQLLFLAARTVPTVRSVVIFTEEGLWRQALHVRGSRNYHVEAPNVPLPLGCIPG